ncbi:MAG: hypothetical protein CXT68_08890 [Methanobacteriota archaeon]|jgi:hypothetical protein|nr:MAG: hypothetical protein CXT68_08890 [Euryarchaeota archaeon]
MGLVAINHPMMVVAVQEEIPVAVQVAVSQDSTAITVHPKDLGEVVVAAEITRETGFEILLRPHSVYGWGLEA